MPAARIRSKGHREIYTCGLIYMTVQALIISNLRSSMFKNRILYSLRQKKLKPENVYSLLWKGQTHINPPKCTAAHCAGTRVAVQRGTTPLRYRFTGSVYNGTCIHFKLDKQATAFQKGVRPGLAFLLIPLFFCSLLVCLAS